MMESVAYDLGYLSDPGVFAVGRLPAVSDHDTFAGTREAETGASSLRRSLNGRWKFSYAENPAARPEGFEQPEYDCSGWGEIDVPAHIQLQGFGRPQYVNIQYPWDGSEALRPPQIPERFNPVGSYATFFTLPEGWADKRVTLVFQGVESAFFVWLNGNLLGYAEDSFAPSRFDLTGALVAGENKLAVEVFRFCSGSWLEDQDFWRFSGIFRTVELRAEPRAHVEDVFVRAVPAPNLRSAELTAELTLSLSGGPATLTAELLDAGGQAVDTVTLPAEPAVRFTRSVPNPRLWSAEEPNLYTLSLTLRGAEGETLEVARTEVGFRRFEIGGGVMLLNGKRLLLHGVDRHEFSCKTGRAVSEDEMLWDVTMLKRHNVNAVRTSHYPNNSLWYRLCDRYGIYLVDETNLETHGTWGKLKHVSAKEALPGDREEWLPACLDRAKSLLERDKNHPSVLFWSCGNESFGGSVIHEMAQFFRRRDPGRLVHYEGVFHDRRFDASDVESRMYPPAAEIEEWLETHRDKPFVLCEYSHAMGNSLGGIHEYLALEDRCPQYQGGFIWDWIDQAIDAPLPGGGSGLAYGGDFGDRPCDRAFCGNGLVFADRTPTPKLMETKYQYQGVRILPDAGGVTLENRNLFDGLQGYRLVWRLTRDGEEVAAGERQDVCVPAGKAKRFPLPLPATDGSGEYALLCELCLKAPAPWAPEGYALMHGQAVLGGSPVGRENGGAQGYTVARGDWNVGIRGGGYAALFSKVEGGPVAFGPEGASPLLGFAPRPSLYRAPTDNDVGNRYAQQAALWRAFSELATPAFVSAKTERGLLAVRYRYALPELTGAKVEIVYTALAANRLRVDVALSGKSRLPDLPTFGLSLRLPRALRNVRYYGLGPWENETDRHEGALLGIHRTTPEENLTPYLRPQYCGNRTGVRWLELTDGEGRGLRVRMADRPLQVSALPYDQATLAAARHRQELPAPAWTFLDVASARCGVAGDDSWGAPALPQYRLPACPPPRLSFILEVL